MANPDIEVTKIINGSELLPAWRECRFWTPHPDAWPPAIEAGTNAALIARSRSLGRKAVGSVTIRWDGPVRQEPTVRDYLEELYPDELTPVIYALHVQRMHRGRGVGRALMKAAEKTIVQQRDAPNRAALNVKVDNEHAIRLYDSLGYQFRKIITVDSPKRVAGGVEHDISKNWIMTKEFGQL